MRYLNLLLLATLLSTPAVAATLLVGNKSDDTVDLIDPATGESSATLPTGKAPHEIAISPDKRLAVVSNYGDRSAPGASLTVIDLAQSKVVRTIDLGEHTRPHGLAWLRGNDVAVTTEGSAHLLVVDAAKGKVVKAIPTGQRVSHMVAVTPDFSRAFVANIGSGSMTAIDLVKGTKLGDVITGEGAEGIAVRPGTKEVWVTNREAGTLSVIDTDSLKVKATIPAAGFPIRIAFTPDGSRALVSAASSGEVVLFDAGARKELLRKKLNLSNAPDAAKRLFADRFGESPVPVGLVISSDGKSAYVAATQSDVVAVIDPATLDVKNLLRAGHEPDGMALK